MTKRVFWWLTHGVTASGTHHWPMTLIVAMACVFLALFLGVALLIATARPDDRGKRLADRIDRYGPRHGPQDADGALARAASRWVAPFLRLGEIEPRLARRLDLAGITWRPAEWVLAGAGLSLGLALALTVFIGNPVIGAIVGALAGWLAMRFGLTVKIGRRRAKFSEQLPDILQFLAGSLRSGFSLSQGLDAAVREDTQPVSGEFSRALAESRIGVEIEDALDQVADRMASADLRWTVIAIRIQREVGGNLAEVLGNTVETMRERAQLRRHVKALSAEGRLSAYILVALPIFVAGWLFLVRRSYIRVLYTTTPGIIMLVFAIAMIIAGAFWMRAMIKVEV